jgi:hypothetical protein
MTDWTEIYLRKMGKCSFCGTTRRAELLGEVSMKDPDGTKPATTLLMCADGWCRKSGDRPQEKGGS